jgi:hypothetical protein
VKKTFRISMMVVTLAILAFAPAAQAYYNTVAVAYGSADNQYMTAYENNGISCRLVSGDGVPVGDAIVLTSSNFDRIPAIAYDSTLDSFLVVWGELAGPDYYNFDIKGRVLTSAGAFVGDEITLGLNSDNQGTIKIAYAPTTGKYLVVFAQGPMTKIVAQMVNGDGTLDGSNFDVIPGDIYAETPSVAWDSVNHRFLVAARVHGSSQPPTIMRGTILNDNGSVYAAPFTILDSVSFYPPSVAFDSANQRFLLIWEVYGGSGHTLHGQLVSADGSLFGDQLAVVPTDSVSFANDLIYNALSRKYLAVWSSGGILAQKISGAGVNRGAAFTAADPADPYQAALAWNSRIGNALLAYKSSGNPAYTTIGQPLAFTVSGRVKNASGSPMKNLRMKLRAGPSVTSTVLTDDEGRFSFIGVLPGPYTLRPSKIGFAFTPAKRTVNVTNTDPPNQNFRALP